MKSIIYKQSIASFLNCQPDKIFLYWKGRVALYAILKALELNEDDEVIIPAFTCVVVPNAILYAGLKPVYVDINEDTFNMNVSLIESVINKRTKVIICQNTFGLSSDIEEIISIAQKYNLYTIEDCTHGFGGSYNGKPNGSNCDAAFYSTQWNKPFSTGIGGFSVINNSNILKKIIESEKHKVTPAKTEMILLKLLLIFRNFFVNKFTQAQLIKIYRFLSKHNMILGSNQGGELNSTIKPDSYFKDISDVQIKTGIKSLKLLKELNMLRRKNAITYTDFLKSLNKNHVNERLFDNHMFLKYPLLVNNREKFQALANKSNITLGDWFISPLHPIKGNLNKWMFDNQLYPHSDKISKQIVNLPTDVKDTSPVLKFLNDNLDLII